MRDAGAVERRVLRAGGTGEFQGPAAHRCASLMKRAYGKHTQRDSRPSQGFWPGFFRKEAPRERGDVEKPAERLLSRILRDLF